MKLFEVFGVVKIDDKKANESLEKTDSKAKKISKSFGNMSKKVGKAGIAVGTMAAAAGGAMFGFAKKTGEALDRVDKMSQRLGMSAESFQNWDFILSQSGVSIDQMQMGMKTLAQRAVQAADGVGKGAENFAQLGIDVKNANGEMKGQTELFEEAITKLQGMESGMEKTALAQELFGRSGQELLPLLNSEAGSIEDLKARAEELGLVQSDEMVKAGAAFTDSVDETTRMLKSMGTEVAVNLLPIVNNFLVWIKKSMPQIRAFFESAFNIIIPLVVKLYTAFNENVLPILKTVFEWVQQNMPIFKETFMTIFDSIWTVVNNVWELFELLLLPILKALFTWVDGNMDTIGDVVGGVFEGIATIIENTIGVIEDVIDVLKDAYDWANKAIKKIGEASGKRAAEREKQSESGFFDVKGMRANGGPVKAGESYIVGEREPELFVPNTNGNILNQEQMANMNKGVTVQQMVVRKQSDIDEIARKLYELQRSTNRGYAL